MYCAASMMGLAMLVAGATGVEPPGEQTAEHPLMPILRYATERYQQLDGQIGDYTCTLVKHERVDGRLRAPEYALVKVRQERAASGQVAVPFSVYLKFLAPESVQGREVIYVRGLYDGKMIVRAGGARFAFVTTAIEPAGDLAMQGNRYPITEIGIQNLVRRLIDIGREDLQHGECEVKYYTGAKINDRTCTVMEIVHPERRPYFSYHIARIFVDDELQLPVRYAAYEWADEPGADPPLIEEYTYLNLKLNVGLTDWDFDYHNPDYEFRKNFKP